MGKKKARASASADTPKKRRKRRSADEIIADLQDEIRRVRARQKSRELKTSPSFKASISAIKMIDKALETAKDEGNTELRHALADARKALGGYLETQGLDLPKAELPKGPRPKSLK